MRSLRHFSITKKLAINGHDYVSLAKDTAHRQLGTIQDYYETPEDSVRIDTAKAIGKFLIRSDESDSESKVTISLEDEYFAKKLEEVASDSAGKQMLEFVFSLCLCCVLVTANDTNTLAKMNQQNEKRKERILHRRC